MKTYSPVLWDHQMEAIAKALPVLQTTGGFYLAHDVGTGKTLTTITLARLLQAPQVLVITSANGISVWDRELEHWWPESDVWTAHGDWGTSRHHRVKGSSTPTVGITSFEQLIDTKWKRPDGKIIRTQGLAHMRELLTSLKRPTMLIVDESHKAKGVTSKVSRAIWKLEKEAKVKIRMSGSSQHTMLDLWAQYQNLIPDDPIFEQPYRDYRDMLVTLGGPNGNWVVGWKEEGKAQVAAAIERYTHAVDASVLELPEPIYRTVPFRLDPEEQKAYDAMATDLAVEFADGSYAEASIVLAKMLRLQQITGGFVPTNEEKIRNLGDSKVRATVELVEKRPTRKIIIGARFTEDLDRLEAALTAKGRPNMRIDGAVSPAKRGQIEDVFQMGEHPWVLLMQEATATAMTLTAAATVIAYSITPRVIDWTQFEGRAYRGGQTKFLEFLAPCADDTIDEELWDGVRSKSDEASMARILKQAVERSAKWQRS